MKAKIARIVADARKAKPGLTVYHELDPTLFSATSKTFVGQVYTALGLKNIADAADSAGFGYPQLSAEYVVSANPDLIVLGSSPRWRRQSRFFSPTVDFVLRKAPCEVLVVAFPEGVFEEYAATS